MFTNSLLCSDTNRTHHCGLEVRMKDHVAVVRDHEEIDVHAKLQAHMSTQFTVLYVATVS